jgi:Flp pilus assembly protein TadD
MMRIIQAAALAVTSAVFLAGCQSVLGPLGLATARHGTVQTAQLDMSDYFDELLANAKQDLRNGRTSQAITAFRQASYDAAHAAESYNGLGVAYATLGRDDLAKQYFALAVSANPSDPRFARNLARLELSGQPALAAAPPEPAPAPAPASEAPVATLAVQASNAAAAPSHSPAPAPVTLAERAAPVRPAEVHVSRSGATLALANAPTASTPSGPRVQAAGLRPSAGATPVRIATIGGGRGSPPAYPIRIDLTKMR